MEREDVSVVISMARYNALLETEKALEKVLSTNYSEPVCFFWEDKSFKKFYIPDNLELKYRGIIK